MILSQNNATRWNNVFLIFNRALKKTATIKVFIIKNQSEKDIKKRLPKEDILITEDWRVLAEIKIILEPFYKQTIHLQSQAEDGIYRIF